MAALFYADVDIIASLRLARLQEALEVPAVLFDLVGQWEKWRRRWA